MDDKSLQYFFRFSLRDAQKSERVMVSFSTPPRILGLYDINYGKFTPAKTLKYLNNPKLLDYPIDLNKDSENFRPLLRNTETKLLGPMLSLANSDEDNVERISVFTRRGILERIMEFCYGRRDFCALVSRFNGKIYMIREEAVNTEFKEQQRKSQHHARLDQLLFVDKPGASPNYGEIYDDNVFQVCIHQRNLGKFNISYVGRVQGIVADKKFENCDDLEAVNDLHFTFGKQMWSKFRHENLKFFIYWIQCYLANVSDIYAAYKYNNGIVTEPIERLEVCDILKKSGWNPDICTTFLSEFLERVDQLMSDVNSVDTVYKFYFNANGKTIHYKVFEGKTEMSFIPEEYADLNN